MMKTNTFNLITSSDKVEQELRTLNKILKDYEKGHYNNVFILIVNYLGHVPHYSEHGDLVYKLLSSFTFSIETGSDSFTKYVKHLISDVEYLKERG